MRRALLAVVAMAALAIPVVASASGKKKTIHFTAKVVGAQISSTEAVFKDHDSYFGDGAGVQKFKVNGLGGTDSETTYFGNSSSKSKGSYKIGTPTPGGTATLTGSGKDIGGTGKAKGLTSTYTYTGTVNINTGAFQVKLTGTYKLP
jgi:type II secretory pathway pseudopilin PulG